MWLPLRKWSCREGAAVTAGTKKKHMGAASIRQSRSQSPDEHPHLPAESAGLRPWGSGTSPGKGRAGAGAVATVALKPLSCCSILSVNGQQSPRGTGGECGGKGEQRDAGDLCRAALWLGGEGTPLPTGLLCPSFHQHTGTLQTRLCALSPLTDGSAHTSPAPVQSRSCVQMGFFLPRKGCGVVENTSFSRLFSSSPLSNDLRLLCNMVFLLKYRICCLLIVGIHGRAVGKGNIFRC